MLYLETSTNTFTPWFNQRINDIAYQPNIGHLWSAEDLAAIGLYTPEEPSVPAGKRVASRTVQRVDGVVTWVYTLADYVPTVQDVHAERDRRLALGFDYDFGDARGVHHFKTTPADMEGWDEVSKLAQALLNAGQATPITIATGTGVTQVTPAAWQSVLIAAAAFRQPIWGASFALETADPIPTDYADDSHWVTP